jgi:hypothetical protein
MIKGGENKTKRDDRLIEREYRAPAASNVVNSLGIRPYF